MAFVNSEVEKQYQRWMEECSENDDLQGSSGICIGDVLYAHFSIVDFFYDEREGEKAVGGVGPRDFNLLSSAVARQNTCYAGTYKWQNDYEKTATLFFGLIKNHPFHDCNKRTAMLSALYYLQKLNRTPTVRHRELENIAIRVADNRLHEYRRFKTYQSNEDGDIYFIADFFRRGTRNIDKRYYIITYHQLSYLLGQFGFKLTNPHKNYIDIYKVRKKRKMFGLGEAYLTETKVGTIGFPGWTKEVPRKEIKALRRYTGLTHRDGFDSEVFYRGAEPLKSLINEYGGLLRRLSRK